MGDAVNLASRLEGLTKAYDTRILISASTYAQTLGHVTARRLGVVRVKGKREPTDVYELRAMGAPVGTDAQAIQVFEEGVERFLARDFSGAEAHFRRVLAPLARGRSQPEQALVNHGRIVLAPDLATGIEFVNAYGPEHLSVDVDPLEETVAQIRNAGSIFVGPWAPESAGDYATGANHVLPTGGLARSCGPLAVEMFGKFSQVQRITREGLASIRRTVGTLAEAEGLAAHREAIEVRFRGEAGR